MKLNITGKRYVLTAWMYDKATGEFDGAHKFESITNAAAYARNHALEVGKTEEGYVSEDSGEYRAVERVDSGITPPCIWDAEGPGDGFSYEELKEASRCVLFVKQLPQVHQESIKNRLTDGFMSEGYNVFQINEILADAMNDKVDAVMEVLRSMENAAPLPLCGTCDCEDGECVYSI